MKGKAEFGRRRRAISGFITRLLSLVVMAALVIPAANPAFAEVTPSPGRSVGKEVLSARNSTDSPEAQMQEQQLGFNIAPQPLAAALDNFVQQTGWQVGYPAELTAGVTSPGVAGNHSAEQALRLLLAKTGLTYRLTGTNTVTLERAAARPEEGVAAMSPGAPSATADGASRLKAVTVTATRVETTLSEVPSSVTIIDAEEVAANPTFERDPINAVSKVVPGANISDPLGSRTSIRGRSVSFRINNIDTSQKHEPTDNVVFDVAPGSIGRVEVVRGSNATYGFGASGGAVNFITPRPIPGPAQFETMVGLSFQPLYGNFSDSLDKSLRQSVTGTAGKVDYLLDAGVSSFDTNFDADGDPLPDDFALAFSNTNVLDLNGTLIVPLNETQRIETTQYYLRNKGEREFTILTEGNLEEGRKPVVVSRDDEAIGGTEFDEPNRSHYVGTLSYKNDAVLDGSLEVTAYRQDREGLNPEFVGGFGQLDAELERNGLRISLDTPIDSLNNSTFAGTRLVWGADYERFEQEERFVNGSLDGMDISPDITDDSYAVFAQLNAPFLEDFLFTGGFRYEDASVELASTNLFGTDFVGGEFNYDQTLFNAGLIYYLNDALETYANFSQAADITDLGRGAGQSGIDSFDDLDPDPATTDQYEIGLRGNWPKVQFTAAAFYSESELGQRFVPPPEDSPQLSRPVREPREIWGAELTLDTQPFRRWGFGGSLSFSDGLIELPDGTTESFSAADIQPLKLVAYTQYSPREWWKNRLQVVHQVARGDSPRIEQFSVDALTFVDFYSEAEVGDGILRLGIENLLNREEFSPNAQVFLDNFEYLQYPGTTVSVSYSLKW